MPLSDNRTPEIVTIPINSVAGAFSYTFDFLLPTPPLNRGATMAQILWCQITWTADATVGTRVPDLDIQNDVGGTAFESRSLNTQTAGQVVFHSWLQGVVFSPLSITGLLRTIPNEGIFIFNEWSFTITDFIGVSAGDAFTGFMQVRLY